MVYASQLAGKRTHFVSTTTSAARFSVSEVDRSRWFLPGHLTPLAHTPTYRGLSEELQRRYNQLFASCFHEHFIFLEHTLVENILPGLIRRFPFDDEFCSRLRHFIAEERIHTEWFHALHRASEPGLYGQNYYHFVRVPPLARHWFDRCTRQPARYPFCLWLTMIIEERTLPIAREMARLSERIEPHYFALHRLHAADEAGHVSCDGEALKRLWPTLSPPLRLLNRWAFVYLLREFFQLPKRAGWRVVLEWAKEKPEVRPLLPSLRKELYALARDPAYLATLYTRRREPRTFSLSDRFRELRHLEKSITGVEGITV